MKTQVKPVVGYVRVVTDQQLDSSAWQKAKISKQSQRDANLSVSEQRFTSTAEPLLVSAKFAALLCGKSLRTWRTWDSAGLIPRPIRIGRSTLWRTDELKRWVVAGCPDRASWNSIA